MRLRGVGTVTGALMAIAFFACVGSDPDASGGTNGIDAGGDTGSSNPGDATSTTDAPLDASDGGSDAARCDKTKPFGDPRPTTGPFNTTDKSELAFTMTSDELIAIVQQEGDLRYTKRASRNDPFEALTPDNLLLVNTGEYEASPSLSPDGKNLYFVRGGALYVAHRADVIDSFGTPELVNVDGANESNVETPRINHAGTRLHWASNDNDETYIADRAGGGYATFVSKRPLAAYLYTPTFSGDELTIYFGANADGGLVMRYATRPTTSAPFGPQIDMPANLLVGYDPLHVTDDDCIMYVRTTKGSDTGKFDIWEARRPK